MNGRIRGESVALDKTVSIKDLKPKLSPELH